MDWDALGKSGKPIVLYGMGNGGDQIFAQLERHGIRAAGVFASDEFVRGQRFHDYPVLTYEQALAQFSDMTVLLAFGSARPEVLSRVRCLAAKHELYAPDFPVVPGALFTGEFAKTHEQALRTVYDRLSDEPSRKAFEGVVFYKLTGRVQYLFDCETLPDEAYTNILRLGAHERFADLGAYRGDTVWEFCRYAKSWDAITAVEPDGYSFRHLVKNTAEIASCACVQAAIGDHAGTILFRAKRSRGSAAGDTGVPVTCDTVDNLLADQHVTFLNIDVEGQEHAAIDGAAQTLRRDKPKLLLAAYHRSCDLFDLPLRVLALQPGYALYLRHLPSLPGWDTNFYFV